MKVITLLNEKGGCGKTTLATNLAVGLMLRGNRVLLIDSDAQGNATNVLQIAKSGGFYHLMVDDAAWQDVVQVVPADATGEVPKGAGLFCIPSNFQTSAVGNFMGEKISVLHLRKRLMEITDLFDYVVVDTQPNPTRVHEAIIFASDYLIMPTDCGSFSSWEGLPDTIAHTQRIRDDAASVGVKVGEIIGIVPNMYRTKTSLAQHMVKSLRETYGELVWKPIPLRQAIQDAQVLREFLFQSTVTPETTDMLWEFVDKVIATIGVKHGSH